jgi:hypothetical protein
MLAGVKRKSDIYLTFRFENKIVTIKHVTFLFLLISKIHRRLFLILNYFTNYTLRVLIDELEYWELVSGIMVFIQGKVLSCVKHQKILRGKISNN